MIFNGYDFTSYLRCNPTRSLLPPVSVQTTEVSNRYGEIFDAAKLGSLAIEVSARLCYRENERPMEVRRKLAAMLHCMVPSKLVLDDDPTRYYMATLSGASLIDNLWRTGKADLTFVCTDPIAYGATVSYGMRTALNFHVAGTYKTYPIVTAKPAAGTSYWRITEAKSGDYVQINHPFDGTETLVIDCAGQSVKIDGQGDDVDVILASNFFALEPGDASLKASSGTATIVYVERWL